MGDDDNDKPKRSWREIDQMREKGGQRRDERPGSNPRVERSQAYRSYKTQLNKLFDGGVLPDVLKSKLEDKGVGNEAKHKKELAAAIVAASNTAAMQNALTEYKAAFGSPDEEDVLAILLGADNQVLVLEAMTGIEALLADGKLKRGGSLKARIKTAQMTIDSPRVNEAAARLLAKL